MGVFRGKRLRGWTAALVLAALTLQGLVVGFSAAAMAADAVHAAVLDADLAPLGLTRADVPCRSDLEQGRPSGEEDGTHHAGKAGCLACFVPTGGAAVMPEVATLGPSVLGGMAAPRFDVIVLVARAATLGQARAPPLSV